MLPSRAIVLGGTLAGVRATRHLAEAGLTVTLLEPTPFLGGEVPRDNPTWMPAVPELLESLHDPRITVMTHITVEDLTQHTGGFRLQVEQSPRYVNMERCTGCAECEVACPVDHAPGGDGRPGKAIYRDPSRRAVPNVYAIEKRGVAPCTSTCPGGIHVQGYVALIAQGKFRQAHDLITQAIPFPGICGRVCFHPCEEQCGRCELDQAISVRALKRFVADYAAAQDGLHWERPDLDPSLPPVAVVGSGPAGLAVAWELARRGVRVTIFEALPVAGGMMAVGIPAYRLPREILQREIAAVEELGVEIHLNTPLGPNLTLDDLFEQGYGAVFLGLGAHRASKLRIPGADLPEVLLNTDFLRNTAFGNPPDLTGKRVLILGGGDVAMDCARTALRLGATQVQAACLEGREQMPAHPWEIEEAEEEGVQMFPSRTFLEITRTDGHVTGVRCAQVVFRGFHPDGRPDMDIIEDSEHALSADVVIFAVGQKPDLSPLPAELRDQRGWLRADPATGRTPLPGVFAAGDVIQPGSVIEAIGAGKRTAASILRFLRGVEVVPAAVERPVARWSAEELAEREHRERHEPSVLPPDRRKRDFAEVQQVFTPEQAIAEANRCLTCAICSECLECVAVCDPQAIDHEARPHRFTLEADIVLLAGGYDLPAVGGIYQLSGGDPDGVMEALLSTLEERGRPPTARKYAPLELPSPARLGIFLCRCGEQIAESLDLDALQEQVTGLPEVVRVEQVPFACLPEGIASLHEAATGLDGAVLAACSCCNLAHVCYSCTTQRVRCRSGLGVWEDREDAALPPWAWEYVNLREHCAWVHDPDDALAVAADLVAAAMARLAAGPSVPLLATVDPLRCRTCGTCQTVCEAEAIRLEADETGKLRVLVDESRCLACGTCAAHCPTGAMVAGRVSDRQLEMTAQALVGVDRGGRVLVFTCNWGGHSGAETAGMLGKSLPAGVRVVRVPCLGRVSSGLLLRTLEFGATGVLLAGCPDDGCRYEFGRNLAGEALAEAQALACLLGLGTERLELVDVEPGDGTAFVREVVRFVAQVRDPLKE